MLGRKGTVPDAPVVKPLGFDDFEMRLGDMMRGERATLGKSLLDIERELRIKAPYIAAIENADLTAFESPSFIAGYVRSYARYLGMNADQAFAKFCAETGFQVAHGMSRAASTAPVAALRARQDAAEGRTPESNFNRSFSPHRKGRFSLIEPGALGSLAVLIGVIALLGYGGWSVLQAVQRVDLAPVDQAPIVISAGNTAALDPLADAAGGDLGAPVITAGLEPASRTEQPRALDVPVLVARDGPISAIDPRKAGVLLDTMAALNSPDDAVKVLADAKPGVEILAARASWISVSSADGTVLFEKILNAGERYAVPALEIAPRLRAGNSSGIYFIVDGKTIGPAAKGPEVVKNVDLSASGLGAIYAAADISADGDLAQFVAQNTVTDALPAAADPAALAPPANE